MKRKMNSYALDTLPPLTKAQRDNLERLPDNVLLGNGPATTSAPNP